MSDGSQWFCQVSWKSAGDCIRNANKLPKIPHSVKVREVEKWSGSPPKVDLECPITFAVILHTHTEWMTDRPDHITSGGALRVSHLSIYCIYYITLTLTWTGRGAILQLCHFRLGGGKHRLCCFTWHIHFTQSFINLETYLYIKNKLV